MNKSYHNKVLYSLICFLSVCTIIMFSQIVSLKNEIVANQDLINLIHTNVNSQISTYYYSLQDLLDKEASLIDSVEFILGDVDAQTLEIPVGIKVNPKEVVDQLTVSIEINDNIIALNKNGVSYEGEINVSLFEEVKGRIILDDGDIVKTESIETFYEISELAYKGEYLINAYVTYTGQTSIAGGKSPYYSRNGEVLIEHNNGNGQQIISEEIITEVNGQIVNNITFNGDEIAQLTEVNDKTALNPGDHYLFYVLLEDSHGLIYKYNIQAFNVLEDGDIEEEYYYNGDVSAIMNKDGKVVCERNQTN